VDQEFVLGIELIDRQHEELFRRLDLLLDSCMTRNCSVEAANMLAYLDDYVLTHFADEEGLQRAYKYPDYEDHCLRHAAFITSLEFTKREIAEKGLTDSLIQHVNQMLIEWFRQHVMDLDRTMIDFLIATMRQQP
jgi:hemerythrin